MLRARRALALALGCPGDRGHVDAIRESALPCPQSHISLIQRAKRERRSMAPPWKGFLPGAGALPGGGRCREKGRPAWALGEMSSRN